MSNETIYFSRFASICKGMGKLLMLLSYIVAAPQYAGTKSSLQYHLINLKRKFSIKN